LVSDLQREALKGHLRLATAKSVLVKPQQGAASRTVILAVRLFARGPVGLRGRIETVSG
jgi:hypothetical protein